MKIDYIYDGSGAMAELRDALGRLVATYQVESGENSLFIGNVSKGVYLLSIRDAAGSTIHRSSLVKQ